MGLTSATGAGVATAGSSATAAGCSATAAGAGSSATAGAVVATAGSSATAGAGVATAGSSATAAAGGYAYYKVANASKDAQVTLSRGEQSVKRIKEFVIAIDTSGSVIGEEVQMFLQKTYNILMQEDYGFKSQGGTDFSTKED